MLLTNYSYITQICGHNHSGLTNPIQFLTNQTMMGRYGLADASPTQSEWAKDSLPTGTQPPYALVFALKGGQMSNTTDMIGDGEFAISSLAQGVAIQTLTGGQGDLISPSLSLVIQLACSILGEATLSASLVGKLEMAASLAGSGDFTASLSLIAFVVTEMTGSGGVSGTPFGTADMSATFTSSSTLSPESLAEAVWNSLAASFNTAGTMGNKLNSAASAGDPWGTELPGAYTNSQAGAIIAQIQTLVDELHKIQGLNPSYPSTTTQSSWTAGDIELAITGDGENTTTMTRQ